MQKRGLNQIASNAQLTYFSSVSVHDLVTAVTHCMWHKWIRNSGSLGGEGGDERVALFLNTDRRFSPQQYIQPLKFQYLRSFSQFFLQCKSLTRCYTDLFMALPKNDTN